MIERYLLRYFLAVIDQGNFSKAALHCRVSQPTLSGGISKLEQQLGRSLFHRTNRRVELTAAGSRLAPHARRIEADFLEAERVARDDPQRRLIRLGIISTLPARWIERALEAAAEASASERLELVEARARELRPLLDRGRVDAALGPVAGEGPASRILFREGYALALHARHPLAARSAIAPEEVAGETMIVRRNCEALPDISRLFTSRGVRPFMAARTTNDERVAAYVRAGLGITVMPRCFAGPGLVMASLKGFEQTRTIGFMLDPIGLARLNQSEALWAFGAALEQCFRERAAASRAPEP